MTRVSIAPPDTEEDVSAEQVTASDAADRQNKPIRNNRPGPREKERRPLAKPQGIAYSLSQKTGSEPERRPAAMIITAKFASTCPVCRRAISVGAKVEWSKGAKACCPTCAGRAPVMQAAPARPRLAAVRAAMGGGRRTGCSCGSVEGASRDGDCWTCRHDA